MPTWSCKVLSKSLFEGEIVPKIPPVLSKAPEQGLDYLRCDRKLSAADPDECAATEALSSAGLPGMLSEFSGSPPSIRITEPATPIPVRGWTPFLDHGFLGPFEGFPASM